MDHFQSVFLLLSVCLVTIPGDQLINRRILCRSDEMTDFLNVGCLAAGFEDSLISLHNITLGYSNATLEECRNENSTERGCEELMSEIQLKEAMNRMSAQQLMTAYRFPPTIPPEHCTSYSDIPSYMAVYYECIKKKTVLTLCKEEVLTGQRVSVWSYGYPGYANSSRYHSCQCSVQGQGHNMSYSVRTFDSQLSCSGNSQNLSLISGNDTLQKWSCGEFWYNEEYSTSVTETLVLNWNGQVGGVLGKFWIEFQGDTDGLNITVHCYPVLDPTTSTTVVTNKTGTSYFSDVITNSPSSKIPLITSEFSKVAATVSLKPPKITENPNELKTSGRTTDTTTNEDSEQIPKVFVYSAAVGGGLLVLVSLITLIIVVRRRQKPEIIDVQVYLQLEGRQSRSQEA